MAVEVAGPAHNFVLEERVPLGLSRVEAEAAKLTHWAATPTVLEAGNQRGPNSTFFPFPRAAQDAHGIAFGTTVTLSSGDGLDFASELLHARVTYEPSDF